MLKWICIILLMPCLAQSSPQAKQHVCQAGPSPSTLNPVFKGPYLSLYTSGRMLRQSRHPKSGVWNTPARKVKEMWARRAGDGEMVRLGPPTFRRQLVEMLADFPEVHGAILHRSFTYKNLTEEIPNLNRHIRKVIIIRREKAGFRAR